MILAQIGVDFVRRDALGGHPIDIGRSSLRRHRVELAPILIGLEYRPAFTPRQSVAGLIDRDPPMNWQAA
jgi:hypothetical protein